MRGKSQKVCESSAAKEKLAHSDEYLLQLDFHNPNVCQQYSFVLHLLSNVYAVM
jgi:predicted AAA+ superfamily ATPase